MVFQLDTSLIDLGKDRDRIGESDAIRQTETVNHILKAFWGPVSQQREIQILADEVGMGKTYVALATAYTALSLIRDTARPKKRPSFLGCYKCVLVVTPGGNPTLAQKWDREDEALLKRCSQNSEKTKWFHSQLCKTSDELLQAVLRADDLRRKNQHVVLVLRSNIFMRRLSDPAVRFLTACLFRWWGTGLQKRQRFYLIRGLSETSGSASWIDCARKGWGGDYEIDLWDWSRHERFLAASDLERELWDDPNERNLFSQISLTYGSMERALNRAEKNIEHTDNLEALREKCKKIPSRPKDRRTVRYREWIGYFEEIKANLRDIFKHLWPYLLEKKFPLVITDEAHHWRNNDAGDFRSIRKFVAPFTKRMLLLTATPFQLNPQETVNVLNVIDHMSCIGSHRIKQLKHIREQLESCMERSQKAGIEFSREWGALADQFGRLDPKLIQQQIPSPIESDPRTSTIDKIWNQLALDPNEQAFEEIPGAIRPFFRRAIELWRANKDLQETMRPLVARHRKPTEHRRFWIGREFPPGINSPSRPDQSRLHLAPGQSLEARHELVQYLLMQVVATLSRGRHRTALGTGLTGCYSTLWASKEGKAALKAASQSDSKKLMKILQRLTGGVRNPIDHDHPKLKAVADEVIRRWNMGEKSLIFCFRVPTAEAIAKQLRKRIEHQRQGRQTALLKARGTDVHNRKERDKAMQQFRRSLTAREGSGVSLFLDRVLIGWLLIHGLRPPVLDNDDIHNIAVLAARARIKDRLLFPNFERPDRVFLHRVIEHIWARRFLEAGYLSEGSFGDQALDLLQQISRETWVRYRYGQEQRQRRSLDVNLGIEHAARSSLSIQYDLDPNPDPTLVSKLENELLSRNRRGRLSFLSGLYEGFNFLSPHGTPIDGLSEDQRRIVKARRKALFDQSLEEGEWDWDSRRQVIDALVRAILRDDILLRMPISVFRGRDDSWAARLFTGFHGTVDSNEQGETLAQRMLAFLQELGRMSKKEREDYLKYAMNPQAESVALVKGETDSDSRNAIFCGFNTPLLPEILVCTAVGQEGIDLHRECSHVIHYDLGWNPATIEQRTGRADRIGSKTERERKLATLKMAPDLPTLDIALPYLAATYDERMFEALRTRAQVFEILTGGDPTADREDETPWAYPDDEGKASALSVVPLPHRMIEDIRVDLGVQKTAP
jgi:hypothetical protein